MNANQPGIYGASAMSDEDRLTILADAILEAISLEETLETETEG